MKDIKNKKILCIMPHYHAYASANNLCMHEILKRLKNSNCEIDILCFDNMCGGGVNYYIENGYNVISITNYYNQAVYKYGPKYNAKNWQGLPRHIRLTTKIKCFLKTLFKVKTDYFSVDAINYSYIKKALKSTYDIIISHSFPFVSHVIAKNLLNKIAKKWYAFIWDPYVYNYLDPISKVNARKKTAQKVLNSADKIFMLYGIKDGNQKNEFFPSYQKNAVEIILPTLKDRTCEKDLLAQSSEREVKLTYAGAFYYNLRQPNKMLEVLSCFPNGYYLYLYGKGCRREIELAQAKFDKCKLIDKGQVSHEESIKSINNSDILINVGNTVTNQLPSKVFEYISMGKPIVNFYSEKEDLGLKFFEKYPLCYNFYTREYTKEDIEKLIAFCEEHKGTKISFEKATENLKEYRAENVCNLIVKEILKEQ